MEQLGSRVLVVDDSRTIAELIEDILTAEGYRVTILNDGRSEMIQSAVDQLVPDCILLDRASLDGNGPAWASADWLANHPQAPPVVMLGGQVGVLNEAARDASPRSHAARFAALLPKPFELDELLSAVRLAVGDAKPCAGA